MSLVALLFFFVFVRACWFEILYLKAQKRGDGRKKFYQNRRKRSVAHRTLHSAAVHELIIYFVFATTLSDLDSTDLRTSYHFSPDTGTCRQMVLSRTPDSPVELATAIRKIYLLVLGTSTFGDDWQRQEGVLTRGF